MRTLTIEELLALPANKLNRKERKRVIEYGRAAMREAAQKFDEVLGAPHFSGRKLERELERNRTAGSRSQGG